MAPQKWPLNPSHAHCRHWINLVSLPQASSPEICTRKLSPWVCVGRWGVSFWVRSPYWQKGSKGQIPAKSCPFSLNPL